MDPIENYIATTGRSLESVGVNNYALSREEALRLLSMLRDDMSNDNRAVLGGDVYELKNGEFSVAYANWSLDPAATDTVKSYRQRSIAHTQQYIVNYPDEDAYFVFVLGRCF